MATYNRKPWYKKKWVIATCAAVATFVTGLLVKNDAGDNLWKQAFDKVKKMCKK